MLKGEEIENKISKYHSRLELVRTIMPVISVCLQLVILWKIFHH